MRKKWMNLKLLVAMMLSIVLSSSLVCYAATPENALAQMISYRISDYLTEEDMSFLNKLTFLYEDFELDDEGSLEINKTYNEIQKSQVFLMRK